MEPPPSRGRDGKEYGGLTGGRSGGGSGRSGSDHVNSLDYGYQAPSQPPPPPLAKLPPRLPNMPFVGPSPRLPEMSSPRGPKRPVGPSSRLQGGSEGRSSDAYDPYRAEERPLLVERPSTLHMSRAVGGRAAAEVLSFLDDDSSSGGAASNGINDSVSGSGGGIGGRSGRLLHSEPVTDSLQRTASTSAGVFDPYGMHDEDVVNAGSVPPSRPMTAATLNRASAASMPRLASPALEALLGPGRRSGGGHQLGAEPSAGDEALMGDEHDGSAYDPYSADGPEPVAGRLSRRPNSRLRPVSELNEVATAVSSASGPALFTSFGDAFRDGTYGGGGGGGSGSAGRGSGGSGGSSDGSAPGGVSSSLLPPSSFRIPPPSVSRSRLARSSIRPSDGVLDEEEEQDGDYRDDFQDDPYEEDDSATGERAALSGLLLPPQGGGGGPIEGGSSMFNASIRSQAGAVDRYSGSGRRTVNAGDGGSITIAHKLDTENGGAKITQAGDEYGSQSDDEEGATEGLLDYDEAELGWGDGEELDAGYAEEHHENEF